MDGGINGCDLVLNLLWEEGRITFIIYNLYDTPYKYDDPEKAFKVLFSKIMVLNIKYPKVCEHVWQFVQEGIFGIPVEKSVMRHVTQEALRSTNIL